MNTNVLYKYRRWDNSVESSLLKDAEIFYSNPLLHGGGNELTLEFEFPIPYETILKIILKQLNKTNATETIEYIAKKSYENINNNFKFKKSINQLLIEKINKNFSIFSLSEVKTSKTLWEYFAGHYSGYCVGIDIEYMHENCTIYGGHFPIHYYSNYEDEFLKLGSNGIVQRQLQLLPIRFNDEQEIRFFKAWMGNNVLTIPREIIKEIIIGNLMDEKIKNEIVEIKHRLYPNATLQVATYIEDGYFIFDDIV